jgi:hypothetical protein
VRGIRHAAAALAAFMLAACGDEGPIGVGGELTGARVVTLEVILEPEQYLVDATTLSGYALPGAAPWMLVAREYGGILDANGLFSLGVVPRGVSYRDAEGVVRTDTLPTYIGGELVFSVDTLRSFGLDQDVVLRLYEVTESWDATTANWTMRVDSPGVQLAWTQPGGTTGAAIDSAVLVSGADTVVFTVDSAFISRWRDTANARLGALIVAETPGVRLRSTIPGLRAPVVLRAHAIPATRPDTVVTATVGSTAVGFVYTPEPPPEEALRIGGLPSHRAYLRFSENFHDIEVGHCGQGGPCVPLRSVTVNSAHLLLEPLPVPEAYQLEDSLRLRGRTVETSALAPRERAPLGDTLNVPRSIAPDAFTEPTAALVEVPITRYVITIARPPEEGERAPTRDIALMALPENALFGYGRFAQGPRLRLVVSFQVDAGGVVLQGGAP